MHAGNMSSCLSSPLRPEVATALQAETLRADPEALGRLMADHTQLDWRPLLPQIQIPCLNLVGMHGGCFNPAGVEYVGQQIPQCETVSACAVSTACLDMAGALPHPACRCDFKPTTGCTLRIPKSSLMWWSSSAMRGWQVLLNCSTL